MKKVIVSAYYKIPSKQSHEFYVNHLKRWIRSVSVPTIFFTTSELVEELNNFQVNNFIIFKIVDFKDLTAFSKFDNEFWKRQKSRDPEAYHTQELAAIWFEKKEFVSRAMEMSDADVFIWCDAGCVRNDESEKALKQFGNRSFIDFKDDRLHLQEICHVEKKEFYSYPNVSIAGAIMAGTRKAWRKHSTLYDSTLLEYDQAGITGNSDQNVYRRCADLYPQNYICHNPPSNLGVDVWFFFFEIL